jgi:hypothetical protein
MQSKAFWTCVAVQAKVAPHLFACLTRSSEDEGVFRLDTRGPDESQYFGSPIPDWVGGEDSPLGLQHSGKAFSEFIKEWHDVLASWPAGLDECVMDERLVHSMPGRSAWLSNRVKFLSLCDDQTWLSPPQSPSVMSVILGSDETKIILKIEGCSTGIELPEQCLRVSFGFIEPNSASKPITKREELALNAAQVDLMSRGKSLKIDMSGLKLQYYDQIHLAC